MKILAIRGKNLASLEKAFEIDFTTEPLKSAGIFAITGSTGSGKSTLLDALCLALFDDTPRISRATENVSVRDVGDKTLNQRDCRNILRRGASHGYAEVDFMSLGKECFRSRWSVKRAHNKSEGSMQSSEIRLYNLSSGNEEQGRKTELLARIVDLIGLTFDQFTRSVLLAQGDFATFLKAKQAEKAELLEKLTGTDIYSRISMAIYEKTKNAEAESDAINRHINEIETLPDEQVCEYNAEKQSIENQSLLLKKDLELLTAQLKWITDRIGLCNEVKQAETAHAEARKAITDARERYEYIAQTDNVQDIRDTFKNLENIRKNLSETQADLHTAIRRRDENARALAEAEKAVSDCEKKQNELDELRQQITPQIHRARELDVLISETKKKTEESQKEHDTAQATKTKTEKNIRQLRQTLEKTEKERDELDEWFTRHQHDKNIAMQTELLLTLTDEAQTVQAHKQNNEKTLATSKELLKDEEKSLDELRQEAERLNKVMPDEIASLRSTLVEGEPCPVCGSLHHPAANIEETQRMKERELEKAKTDNTRQTERLTAKIEQHKSEIIKLSALVENYTTQYTDTFKKLESHFTAIHGWQELLAAGQMKDFLIRCKKEWDEQTERLTQNKEKRGNLSINLENEKEKLQESDKILHNRSEQLEKNRQELARLQSERTAVLHGKPADAAEKYFTDRQNLLTMESKQAMENRNKLSANQKSLHDNIAQRQTEITKLNTECETSQKTVEQWIAGKEGLTYERLNELLSKSNSWIQAEKEALKKLTEKETVTRTTLSERQKRLTQHNESDAKPKNENETPESLKNKIQELNSRIEKHAKRHTEIEVLLATDTRNRKQLKAFEEERKKKNEYTENWKKLNVLLGSASGDKFKKIAQGYTLETLLGYANKHLHELTPRYQLQRIPDSLALQVVDTDMLNEIRTVHSLSGGESFLISLALALGLSSLSSNRMKVESLFIDEGFGSLDNDTLRTAMDALEHLQMQGRKIGVISHIAEMTERIAARIKVVKMTNGKSEIKIEGHE